MSPEKEYGAAEYLCYEVVRQMEDRDRDVPETDFNKFCSLVYEEVTGEDVDVPLPIYWYEYGNVVDTNHISDSLLTYERTRWGSNWGNKVTTRDVSDDAFEVADNVLESIKTAANSVANRFGKVYGTSYARYQSYDRQAPNEFIKVMNEFRDILGDYEGADLRAERNTFTELMRRSVISPASAQMILRWMMVSMTLNCESSCENSYRRFLTIHTQ